MEWKLKSLLLELTQGKALAEQLRNHLGGLSPSSSTETRECLVKKLLSSYEKALSLLNWDDDNNNNVNDFAANTNTSRVEERFAKGLSQEQHHKGAFKRRKTSLSGPSWTEQVRSWSEPSRQGANDDGYSWRKYGQKEIIGSTFPRGYYRCARHQTQGCLATKQVQRSDEDPTIFNVKYCGLHTCVQFSRSHVTDQHHQENNKSTSRNVLDQHLDAKEDEFLSQALLLPSITPGYVEEYIFGDSDFEHIPHGQSSDLDMVSDSFPISYTTVEDIYLLNHNVDFGENYQLLDSFEPLE